MQPVLISQACKESLSASGMGVWDSFVSAIARRLAKKWEPAPCLHLYRGIKRLLREPAGRLESHDKGPVGMGCQACQLPTPNEHLAKAGRTHSSSTLPACDRETSRQLDRRRMWQLARRKALAWLRMVTVEINGGGGRKKRGENKNSKSGGLVVCVLFWICNEDVCHWWAFGTVFIVGQTGERQGACVSTASWLCHLVRRSEVSSRKVHPAWRVFSHHAWMNK